MKIQAERSVRVNGLRNKFLDRIKKLSLHDAVWFIVEEEQTTDLETIIAILAGVFDDRSAIKDILLRMDFFDGVAWFNATTGQVRSLRIHH